MNNDLRRKIGVASLIAAPAMMLVADLLRFGAGMDYAWLVLMKLSFVSFLPAILAIVHLVSRRSDGIGLVGGGLAMAGVAAGYGIFTAFMMIWAIEATGDAATIGAVERALAEAGVREYVFFYPISGLFFPIGLLVLSVGLVKARAVSPAVVALFALGAVLFPVGRIGQVEAAVIGSGVALTIAMTAIAWRVLSERKSSPESLNADQDSLSEQLAPSAKAF